MIKKVNLYTELLMITNILSLHIVLTKDIIHLNKQAETSEELIIQHNIEYLV